MSKSKHTPGPWKWICRYDNLDIANHHSCTACENFDEGRVELFAANGKAVVSPWADYASDMGLDVRPPDARLIAAAPDLLAALTRAMEIIDAGDDLSNEAFYGTEHAQFRAALARARGES